MVQTIRGNVFHIVLRNHAKCGIKISQQQVVSIEVVVDGPGIHEGNDKEGNRLCLYEVNVTVGMSFYTIDHVVVTTI